MLLPIHYAGNMLCSPTFEILSTGMLMLSAGRRLDQWSLIDACHLTDIATNWRIGYSILKLVEETWLKWQDINIVVQYAIEMTTMQYGHIYHTWLIGLPFPIKYIRLKLFPTATTK